MTLRTARELRLVGLLGHCCALVAALLAAFIVHLIFGRAGRGGFTGLNLGGILEFLIFVITHGFALIVAKSVLRLPTVTLLSFGLNSPPTCARVAQPVAILEHNDAWQFDSFSGEPAILQEHGKPVGLRDDTARLTPWENLPRVAGEIIASELRNLLIKNPLVVIVDHDKVHGLITREMYLEGFRKISHRNVNNQLIRSP